MAITIPPLYIMKLFIEVNIPSSYKLNWDAPKPSSPLMSVFGWYDKVQSTWGTCLAGHRGNNGWIEEVSVVDYEGTELPDQVYVIVLCSGWWDGHDGGSSWYASSIFIDVEKAKAYVEKNSRRLAYYWVVPVGRRS